MSEISLFLNNVSPFDQIKRIDSDGSEYWLATELLALMGYQAWKRIKGVVERVRISIKNSGLDESCHLDNVVQMAPIGASQAFRETLKDFKLSRHACYLVAMNADPRKPEIAAAQNYFAVKTREAELAPQLKSEKLYQIIEELFSAIALLQSQVQTLLPLSSNAAPPGWNPEVWQSLPPQDKRHFRYIFRRRGFRPSHQGKNEPLALPAVTIEQVKQKQLAEVQQHRREASHEEREKLEAAKQEVLRKFWLQEEDVAF